MEVRLEHEPTGLEENFDNWYTIKVSVKSFNTTQETPLDLPQSGLEICTQKEIVINLMPS